jgi:hypothetical protein
MKMTLAEILKRYPTARYILHFKSGTLDYASAEQVATQVKQLEYEKRSLDASLRRQTADWNHLIEPKRLDEAVRQNGMSLSYAPPERSIIVRKDGRMEIPAALHASLQESRIAKSEQPQTRRVASTRNTTQRTTRRRR